MGRRDRRAPRTRAPGKSSRMRLATAALVVGVRQKVRAQDVARGAVALVARSASALRRRHYVEIGRGCRQLCGPGGMVCTTGRNPQQTQPDNVS